MTPIEALIERVEAAQEGDQARLIEEAWWAMMPNYADVRQLRALLDAGGYLDAAMLVAEGFGGEVTFFKNGTAKAFLWQPYPMAIEGKAATPALALTAAALRARTASREGE